MDAAPSSASAPPARAAARLSLQPPPAIDAPSSSIAATSLAHPTSSGKKQKMRPSGGVSKEERDLALMRAAAELRPQHAAWGHIKKTWQKVVDRVVAELGDHGELTFLSCQRRYEALVERFIARRNMNKHWPVNPELRALLDTAAADHKPREAATVARGPRKVSLPPQAMLKKLKVAVESASNKTRGVQYKEEDDASEGSEDSEIRSSHDSRLAIEALDACGSPLGRRSFVGSTLVAVLDRLARFEDTWLANEREERELKRLQLELERETRAMEEAKADAPADHLPSDEGEAHSQPTTPAQRTVDPIVATSAAESTQHSVGGLTRQCFTATSDTDAAASRPIIESEPEPVPPARVDGTSHAAGNSAVEREKPQAVPSTTAPCEFEELQRSVAALTTSLTTSTQDQLRLTEHVAHLAATLSDVRQEKDVLQRDVATLQALLRDAASLAGTLRTLRDAHQQHEAYVAKFVRQQDARIDALELEVKERRPRILNQLGPLKTGTSGERGEDAVVSIQQEHERLHADHRERLAQFDAPVNELKATIATQAQRLQQHGAAVETTQRDHLQTKQALTELRSALEKERADRDDEYGTLLKTIEQVVAGQNDLV